MPKGSIDIEAVTPGAGQDDTSNDVDDEPDEGDHEHHATQRIARVAQSNSSLDEDPDRERHEQHAVRERRQHLRALVAERPSGGRRLAREPHCDESEDDRDVVGEHVHRVREQRQAPGGETAYHLDDGVGNRQRERDGKSATTLHASVIVTVAHDAGSTVPAGRRVACRCRPAEAPRSSGSPRRGGRRTPPRPRRRGSDGHPDPPPLRAWVARRSGGPRPR